MEWPEVGGWDRGEGWARGRRERGSARRGVAMTNVLVGVTVGGGLQEEVTGGEEILAGFLLISVDDGFDHVTSSWHSSWHKIHIYSVRPMRRAVSGGC